MQRNSTSITCRWTLRRSRRAPRRRGGRRRRSFRRGRLHARPRGRLALETPPAISRALGGEEPDVRTARRKRASRSQRERESDRITFGLHPTVYRPSSKNQFGIRAGLPHRDRELDAQEHFFVAPGDLSFLECGEPRLDTPAVLRERERRGRVAF